MPAVRFGPSKLKSKSLQEYFLLVAIYAHRRRCQVAVTRKQRSEEAACASTLYRPATPRRRQREVDLASAHRRDADGFVALQQRDEIPVSRPFGVLHAGPLRETARSIHHASLAVAALPAAVAAAVSAATAVKARVIARCQETSVTAILAPIGVVNIGDQ